MLKITIPKPCHEDWEAMTPNQQGRHCTACAKTVTDFTVLSDEEVKQFFLHQKEERVCGRFKQEQLHRIIITLPTNILQITMPRWKQFLTACLLAFSSMLFSCDALIDNIIKGEPAYETTETLTGALMIPVPATIDTIVTPPVDAANCTTLKGDTILIEYVTQGCISIEPPTPEPNIAIVDSAMPFVGKVIIDSNVIIPIIPVDSVKKNPLKADSINCNNIKYY
jgi:hypothetical protein